MRWSGVAFVVVLLAGAWAVMEAVAFSGHLDETRLESVALERRVDSLLAVVRIDSVAADSLRQELATTTERTGVLELELADERARSDSVDAEARRIAEVAAAAGDSIAETLIALVPPEVADLVRGLRVEHARQLEAERVQTATANRRLFATEAVSGSLRLENAGLREIVAAMERENAGLRTAVVLATERADLWEAAAESKSYFAWLGDSLARVAPAVGVAFVLGTIAN